MISFGDKQSIKKFFNDGGYVLDFSDFTFDEFTFGSIGIAVKEKYELSKGRSFGCLVDEANDKQIIKPSSDLLEYYENLPNSTFIKNKEKDEQANKLKRMLVKYKEIGDSVLIEESNHISDKFNNIYIEKQIRLMRSMIEESPADSIGKSKELLESCFKYILDDLGELYENNITLQQLRKRVFSVLNLDAKQNINAQSNSEVKKILSGLTQIIDGINNLRNEKGDGHGKGKNFLELPPRYARLVVNSTISIVRFVWETYELSIQENTGEIFIK